MLTDLKDGVLNCGSKSQPRARALCLEVIDRVLKLSLCERMDP